jgi:hypothetical protein|tara:strand:- start:1358 stop:1681 length:324 start_codon:yes stop_codon:yes gene_type:complete
MKITKQRLKEIIKEELQSEARPASERPDRGGPTFDMSVEELVNEAQLALRQLDESVLDFNSAIARLTEEPHKLGEFVHLSTHGRMLGDKLEDLKERWTIALGNSQKE